MTHKDHLIRIRNELIERRSDLQAELINLPEGVLVCTKKDDLIRYYQRIPATGNRKKERRYGIKRQPEILNGLVRKEYITKALKVIDMDIRAVDLAARRYKPVDENSVMESFVEKHPEIAGGIYRTQFDEDEWRNRFSRIEGYHSESLNQTAADGTKMRSKNEVYIASRLDHYGITYRSDCPTGIPGLYRIPDYTILRKRDNNILYWEHFGMMDDPEYRIDSHRKIEEYEAAGIVPWDNLIITYDTAKGGLRADLIEAMIQCWIL